MDNKKMSNYFEELSKTNKEAAKRYLQKIEKNGGYDPFYFRTEEMSFQANDFPPVSSVDIVAYLVLTTSYYTKKQMKAYKSLSAHKYFDAGFVSGCCTKKFDKHFLVLGNIKHSQKLNCPPLRAWFVSNEDGSIEFGHCTCIAGSGEVCSHIGALLYAVNHIYENRSKQSCTDVLSTWNVPTTSKVEYKPISEINYGKKVSSSFDNPQLQDVPPLSEQDILLLITNMKEVGNACGIERIVEPFASDLATSQITLPDNPYMHLYNEEFEIFEEKELLHFASNLEISMTEEEAIAIQQNTIGQSNNEMWFTARIGRITASVFKAACVTSLDNPSLTTIKRICYPTKMRFKNVATEWGKKHEKDALRRYEDDSSPCHDNLRITNIGLVVKSEYPFLGASPDAIVECDCCGKGVVEIKCPYILKNMTILEFAQKKNTCLIQCDENVYLDRNHSYYFQIQMQMALTECKYGDFVVWSKTELFTERIEFDYDFWNLNLLKARQFHQTVILPELIGRQYTRGKQLQWCYCRSNDDGKPMIECCNENCLLSWYHLECVGIDVIPDDAWYCDECKKKS